MNSRNTTRIFTSGILLLWVALSRTHAEDIGWVPGADYRLGHGIDPLNPASSKKAVVSLSTTWEETRAGETGFMTQFFMHSMDEIQSFDANLALSVKALSGSAKFSLDSRERRTSHSHNLNFVVRGQRPLASKVYKVTGFTNEFLDRVRLYKEQGHRGSGLHRQLVKEFGSQVIIGERKIAKVWTTYSLNIGSNSVSRSLAFEFSGRYGVAVTGGVDAAVRKAFERKDTTVTLNAQSSTTSKNLLSKNGHTLNAGVIKTLEDFSKYSKSVYDFLADIQEAEVAGTSAAVISLFEIDGYRSLIGLDTSDAKTPEYDRFIKIFERWFAVADQLDLLTSNPSRMTWANSAGKRLLTEARDTSAKKIADLRAIGKQFVNEGDPLVIPDGALNGLPDIAALPLPQIKFLGFKEIPYSDKGLWIFGYVDCGAPEQTNERPFTQVTLENIDGKRTRYNLTHPAKSPSDPYGFIGIKDDLTNWGKSGSGELISVVASTDWQALENAARVRRIAIFRFKVDAETVLSNQKIAVLDGLGDVIEEKIVSW